MECVGALVDHLTHYYLRGSIPFQTISALSDCEALKIMEGLADDPPLFFRFKEPIEYMNRRKHVEKWVRIEFIAKGGQPKDEYPLYAVLGNSNWVEKYSSVCDLDKARIPLSIFDEGEVSFTYPDSMVSHQLSEEKPATYYHSEYHGKIFTFQEAMALVHRNGLSVENWGTVLAENTANYIEAQIWNHKVLLEFLKSRSL